MPLVQTRRNRPTAMVKVEDQSPELIRSTVGKIWPRARVAPFAGGHLHGNAVLLERFLASGALLRLLLARGADGEAFIHHALDDVGGADVGVAVADVRSSGGGECGRAPRLRVLQGSCNIIATPPQLQYTLKNHSFLDRRKCLSIKDLGPGGHARHGDVTLVMTGGYVSEPFFCLEGRYVLA
jgi:hypothetical protein